MKLARRLSVVLMAYVCGAIVAAIPVLAIAAFTSGVSSDWDASELLFAISFLALIAAIYALPIAVPVIVVAEIRKMDGWVVFAVAGLLVGLLMAALFTEVPFRGIDLELSATMITSSVCGAMAFWLIAWRLLPPERSQSSDVMTKMAAR